MQCANIAFCLKLWFVRCRVWHIVRIKFPDRALVSAIFTPTRTWVRWVRMSFGNQPMVCVFVIHFRSHSHPTNSITYILFFFLDMVCYYHMFLVGTDKNLGGERSFQKFTISVVSENSTSVQTNDSNFNFFFSHRICTDSNYQIWWWARTIV